MNSLEMTLRRSTILVVLIAIFAFASASASAAPLGYVVGGSSSNFVSVFDTQTDQTVGKPIQVGNSPEDIAITPNGAFAYVVNRFGGGTISVIDTATRSVVKTITVGENLAGVAIAPDGSVAYVSVANEEKVALISTATNSVIGELKVKGQPAAPAVTPDGKFVWVPRTAGNEGSIEIFDAQTRQPVGSIETQEGSFGLVFTPDGREAYVIVLDSSSEVWAIDTGLRRVVKKIPGGQGAGAIAVSPDGSKAYVSFENEKALWVVNTLTNERVGSIPVGSNTGSVALAPDGKTAYVAAYAAEEVIPIDLATGKRASASLSVPGASGRIVVAPDQSPTAAFTAPGATATLPAAFSGAASTDPDGTVAGWNWSFGDGGLATGVSVGHTFGVAGTFGVKLSVVDNEGCGEATVFTGSTAYCSGNVGASVTHPVTVAALPPRPLPLPTPPNVCPSAVRISRVTHNRRNGTVRLQVKVPAKGSLYLFGKKVHAVTRRSVSAGSAFLTLHARVEVNKRLKKDHRTRVAYRVSFYPAAGCGPITVHRSLALLRAPRRQPGRR